MIDLRGHVVLITGATRGIGWGLAEALLARGARVHGTGTGDSLDGPAGARLRALLAPGGGRAWPLDLEDPASISRLIDTLPEERLDLLVLNAAILGPMGALTRYPAGAFDRVLRINVSAQAELAGGLLGRLAAAEGQVIALSSGVGRRGRAGWGAYAASKFALEGLCQVLADEWAPHRVRVNAVNPGGTRTDMRAAAKPLEDPGTLPTPADIAPAFLFLIGEGRWPGHPEVDGSGLSGASIDARDWL